MFFVLTPGKMAGRQSISDECGIAAALALAQRGILRKAIAKAEGLGDVPADAAVEFKKLVISVFTQHALVIQLDPGYGLPAANCRDAAGGLLLAYEQRRWKTGSSPRNFGTTENLPRFTRQN